MRAYVFRDEFVAYIARKPWQTGPDESFIGKFRDECLMLQRTRNRIESKGGTARWRRHYTEVRPHVCLGDQTPAEFKPTLSEGRSPAPPTHADLEELRRRKTYNRRHSPVVAGSREAITSGPARDLTGRQGVPQPHSPAFAYIAMVCTSPSLRGSCPVETVRKHQVNFGEQTASGWSVMTSANSAEAESAPELQWSGD